METEASEANDARPKIGFEYLDHTADVQIHAWGPTLEKSFEQAAKAMFGYMTDLERIEEQSTFTVSASGHDLSSLLYSFLDEWLFAFSADPFFVPFKVDILELNRGESDSENQFTIKSVGYGENFDLNKHSQLSEVKAITYSAMQIIEKEDLTELFVIVDI